MRSQEVTKITPREVRAGERPDGKSKPAMGWSQYKEGCEMGVAKVGVKGASLWLIGAAVGG